VTVAPLAQDLVKRRRKMVQMSRWIHTGDNFTGQRCV
jgi:hypothetical protein